MSIPATHAEIEQLYIEAELANCRTLCITACQSGDGVTSLAMAMTERYLLAGYRTLLMDLNLHSPSFRSLELVGSDNDVQWIEHTHTMHCFTGLPSPTDSPTLLMYKRPGHLKEIIGQWQNQYERIVIDTSPLLAVNRGNIPAQNVAAACDYTLLSVLGGITSKHQINKAMELLSSDSIQLLGTVLNRREHPSLTDELCRQTDRIRFLPASWRKKLKIWLQRNEFLSIQT